jgi:NAD(P)-dependent dehydrogenase (short-subunit alcohol dehydrogenase family)
MEKLKDRVAIVTGSGQGMGLAIVHAWAREEAKIVITDVNYKAIETAVAEIKMADHSDVIGIKTDVTRKSDAELGVKQTLEARDKLFC